MNDYTLNGLQSQFERTHKEGIQEIKKFKDAFNKSRIKSIDMFIAINPKLAPIGKYIIAFEIFRAEQKSRFGEEAKLEQKIIAFKKSVSVQEDLAKLPAVFINDGTGIPSK